MRRSVSALETSWTALGGKLWWLFIKKPLAGSLNIFLCRQMTFRDAERLKAAEIAALLIILLEPSRRQSVSPYGGPGVRIFFKVPLHQERLKSVAGFR